MTKVKWRLKIIIKIKILNKNKKKNKFAEHCRLPDFKSRCWHFWQGFSQRLCPFSRVVCWAVGQWMLLLPMGQLPGEISLWCLSPDFPWWYGLCGAGGFSEVILPEAGLWVVTRPFCPQGKQKLSFWVNHFSAHDQFLQGGQICCWFYQMAAVLLCQHSGKGN
jgi:hypothetical protein